MKVSYRAAAHDVQHFSTWADEVTTAKKPQNGDENRAKEMSLAECSAEFTKYGALAEELRSQAEVHSGRLAVVLGKLWGGTTRLLVQLFRLNARLNSEKEHLQRDLEAQKRVGMDTKNAFLVELGQMKLQLTVARAAVRDKDSEVLNLSRSNKHMKAELVRVRKVIGTYIEGHPEEEINPSGAGGGSPGGLMGDQIEAFVPAIIEVLGTKRQKDVFELDDEVDALFAMISHENQRQTKFSDDIDRMVDSLDFAGGDGGLAGFLAGGLAGGDAPDSTRAETADGLAQTKDSEFEMLSLGIEFGIGSLTGRLAGGSSADSTVDNKTGSRPSTMNESRPGSRGGGGRPGSRSGGGNKRRIPKIPPPKIVESDFDKGIVGWHIPVELRAQMSSFPRTMRIPSLMSTLKFTLQMFLDKMKYDATCDAGGNDRLTVPEFVYFFFMKKYGLEKLADVHTTQLQLAMLHHRQHKRINLLAMTLGAYDVEWAPPLTLRDTNFLFGVLANLKRFEAFNEKILQDKDGQIDIGRNIAVASVKSVFAPILPDGGVNIMNRITTLPAPSESKNAKAVDLDHLLELCVDRWLRVNNTWKAHLSCLFEMHCSLFEVVNEMSFCLESHPGSVGKDAILLQLDRSKLKKDNTFLNSWRDYRNLEIAMKMKDPNVVKGGSDASVASDNSTVGGGSLDGDGGSSKGGGATDHSVELGGGVAMKTGSSDENVALLTKEGFQSFMLQVKPGCTEAEILALFDKGIARSHERCLQRFRKLWRRYETAEGQPFWHNRWKNTTQWQEPFEAGNFHPEDFEQDVFVEICLEARLLESSPFVSLLDKDPRDLWSDSEIFLHELEQERAEQRAREEQHKAQEEAKRQAEAASRAKAGSTRRGIQKVQIPEIPRRPN